jgi:hypothetical protein
VNCGLKISTPNIYTIHTYLPDLRKLNRNFTHSLFAECVINGPRLCLCVLNDQYVFAKNELTNFVVQDVTGVSECRKSTQEMACGPYSRSELLVNKAPNGLNKYCPF